MSYKDKVVYFFDRVRDVKVRDILSIFPMILALFLSLFLKKRYKNSWLFTEDPNEAKDNGFVLFKYVYENEKEIESYYAINKRSKDYLKLKNYNNIIEYGSLKHWIIYFCCKFNISSQKGGKPNAAICAFFELNGIFKNKNIFLQHGVIINNLEWLYNKNSAIKKFVTSTIPEYNYIVKNFGYNIEDILLTGLPRFDNLHDIQAVKNQILIMPTWRSWFVMNSKIKDHSNEEFISSNYLRKWEELINSERFDALIKKYNLRVIFYPHRQMQPFIDEFSSTDNIIIANDKKYDVQNLLKTSKVLITDYSSVFFDMIYMKKPVMFYQFDYDEFREYQYKEGYFDYKDNSFGKSFDNVDDILINLEQIIKENYKVSDKYLLEHKEYFKYFDTKNSKRIVDILKSTNI